MSDAAITRPQLPVGVRLHWDRVRERHVLLYPEGALALNQSAVDVLDLCDGERTVDEIAATLSEKYSGADVSDDVRELLAAIAERGLVGDAGS
jgi:pyrroloquinoline quinone biosynthesis protein D